MQQGAPQALPTGFGPQQPFGGQPQFGPTGMPQPFVQQQPFQLPFGAPQGQPGFGAPGQQAAPVQPVSCPTYAGPSAAPTTQGQQSPYARQAISIARVLEQAIPSYQILIAVLQETAASPRGESLTGIQPLMDTLREVTFQHYAVLGNIRRLLCGETTSDVALSMALALNQLARLHTQLRPQVERLAMSAAPELRNTMSGLAQSTAATDNLLGQAATGVQQLVGPQVWDAARARAYGAGGQSGI